MFTPALQRRRLLLIYKSSTTMINRLDSNQIHQKQELCQQIYPELITIIQKSKILVMKFLLILEEAQIHQRFIMCPKLQVTIVTRQLLFEPTQ